MKEGEQLQPAVADYVQGLLETIQGPFAPHPNPKLDKVRILKLDYLPEIPGPIQELAGKDRKIKEVTIVSGPVDKHGHPDDEEFYVGGSDGLVTVYEQNNTIPIQKADLSGTVYTFVERGGSHSVSPTNESRNPIFLSVKVEPK
jgi:hypothetical protein